jgi:hypothetical protein
MQRREKLPHYTDSAGSVNLSCPLRGNLIKGCLCVQIAYHVGVYGTWRQEFLICTFKMSTHII